MSLSKKYQLPVYDPPAVYTDFTGGINTSLSNESLQPNELRDGLNCHYSNSALVNRPGASLVKKLQGLPITNNYQGDFIFAAKRNSWMISVRNGHIYYGQYNVEQEDLIMSELDIPVTPSEYIDSPDNYLVGIPIYNTEQDDKSHEGYICAHTTPGELPPVDPSDDVWQTVDTHTFDTVVSGRATHITYHTLVKISDPLSRTQRKVDIKLLINWDQSFTYIDTPSSGSAHYEITYCGGMARLGQMRYYKGMVLLDGSTMVNQPNGDGITLPLDVTLMETTFNANADFTVNVSIPAIPEPDPNTLYSLRIQNQRRVQGIPVTFKDLHGEDEVCFLMATGTRLIKIREVSSENVDSFLIGEILTAYVPNAWEYQHIGVNNLSPNPNYLIKEVVGAPSTEIGFIMTLPYELDLQQTTWEFSAVIACLTGYDKSDFYYKWEVKIKNKTDWKVLWYWNASLNPNDETSKGKHTIQTTRSDVETLLGEQLSAGDELLIRCALTSKFSSMYDIATETYKKEIDEDGDYVSEQADAIYSRTHVTKVIRDEYTFGVNDVDRTFYKIHSSTKIVADGQKALIYDSAPSYNSAEWFKTVISNYNYITYNGSLDFKTTKNEKIIGVVVFDTNIVVFSDNEQLGGNISVVSGNGDDYNDGQYYSPYKRNVANTKVSCDAYNTIQVADNYIIFKYRKDIYMLDTNDLSNTDTVRVESINDMVRQKLNSIEFPLDRIREPREGEHLIYDFHELRQQLKPDEIFSEVVDGYYGLIFPYQGFFVDTLEIPTVTDKYYEGAIEKYQNTLIENVSIKPGLRWKCYFREGHLYQNYSKTLYPWLRDTSYLFDICSVLYIEGIPHFVRTNGDLITFNNYDGTSYITSDFKLRFKSKAYDMEAPALCKFLDNLCIYYNRDFENLSQQTVWVHNEAAYELYGPENEAYITLINGLEDQVRYDERIKFDEALNLLDADKPIERYENEIYLDPIDKPVEILNSYEGIKNERGEWINPVLNRPSYTSRTFVPRWRFPFLSAQVTVEVRINQAFSLSALNFSYTSSDMPDFTRERLYRDIIRNNYK